MPVNKNEVLEELLKLDNIVTDYWELQKEAALSLFHNLLDQKSTEDIKEIIDISQLSNIGEIAKDALFIAGTRIMEDDDYEL
jgi:hypothetical protein